MPVLVEMGWGGLVQAPATITWTDITPRVDMMQGVTITRGASDELSETQPGTATLTLDNQDGALTPGNPSSPYYPYVRRNAPIRISALYYPARKGAGPYPLAQLCDDFDDGVVDPALWTASGGSVEVGGRLRQPVVSGSTARHTSARTWVLTGSQSTVRLVTVPAGGGSSSMSVNWYLNSAVAGTRMRWAYNGLTRQLRATSEVGGVDDAGAWFDYDPIKHAWLRIRETSGVTLFETSPDGWSWTARRSVATPAWVGTDQVQVDFVATRTGGISDYIEWDYLGAQVRPRFYGVVNEWPVEWEGLLSRVTVSATDLFKRLNRLPALRSMLGEEIIADGAAVYYPLTEPATSRSAGPVVGTGASVLAITQAGSGGTLAMASVEGPTETGESAPLFTPASATSGKCLVADIGAAYEQATIPKWMVLEAWFQTTTTTRAIVGVTSSDMRYQMVLSVSSVGGLIIESTDMDNTLAVEAIGALTTLADGRWHHVVYDQAIASVWVDGVRVSSTVAVQPMSRIRKLHVGGYRGTRLWSGSIGHVALYASSPPIGAGLAMHWTAATTGYAGETADVRVGRLAQYAKVPSVTVIGSTHDRIASQGPAGSGVVARLREVEATESGRLYATRDGYGLAYQSRDVRYNPGATGEAFTIAYADLDTLSVQLSDDDQKLCNQVQASRPGGATQTVTAPSSILAFGVYEQQLNILKVSDNSVTDAAYWTVSRYADPDPELREVPVEAYTLPSYEAILGADISSYFSVTNLPPQAPATSMRVTVEGYTETLKERSHLIQFRTSATTRDSVWVLGDAAYGVLDSTTRLAY
ncbi:LamG domain-containing protein [Streptomyces sp. NBC_01221]|uniref:LamG-like jellyroll fold domain-containing protein n=1 Tax=Streptomyces sp. NBC_01221 TaxID=2903782 RepID=UPI00224EE70A|nr:LamG-like jellyroll fold domain-containing protein [Streptomyces sp. NBC_01221]MCX4786459.1 LamG domain-containing protein [Streptomyces sp. NBC_01221]